jgi:hypothetical protein
VTRLSGCLSGAAVGKHPTSTLRHGRQTRYPMQQRQQRQSQLKRPSYLAHPPHALPTFPTLRMPPSRSLMFPLPYPIVIAFFTAP